MTRYVLRRLLGAVPLVLGVATLIFFVLNLAPGDPVARMVGPSMSAEVADQIRHNFGLDQPVPVRYLRWMANVLRGDFGYSYANGRPVMALVLERLPNTLLLSLTAMGVAFLVGILLGVVQAVRQYSLTDSVLSVTALFFYSMPSFWLALMLVLSLGVFARNVWDWPIYFPVSGVISVDYEFMSVWGKLLDRLWHLFLPALSLGLVLAAGVARYMRSSMLEVINQDYIRTARAKGLPESTVIFRHALRNGLIPIVTLLGLYLPYVFSGTVLIESVFAWQGMGRLMVDSIFERDYGVVMAGSFIFATLVVLGNLLADVLYSIVDPRIRHD